MVPFAHTTQAPNSLRMIELKLVIPDEVKLLLVEDWYHVVTQKKASPSIFVASALPPSHTLERRSTSAVSWCRGFVVSVLPSWERFALLTITYPPLPDARARRRSYRCRNRQR